MSKYESRILSLALFQSYRFSIIPHLVFLLFFVQWFNTLYTALVLVAPLNGTYTTKLLHTHSDIDGCFGSVFGFIVCVSEKVCECFCMKSTVIGTLGSLVLDGWNRTFACTVCTKMDVECVERFVAAQMSVLAWVLGNTETSLYGDRNETQCVSCYMATVTSCLCTPNRILF